MDFFFLLCEMVFTVCVIYVVGKGTMMVHGWLEARYPSPSQRPEAWGIGAKKEPTPFDDWDKRFAEEHLAHVKPDAVEALKSPYSVPAHHAVAGEHGIRVVWDDPIIEAATRIEMTGHGGGGGGGGR